MLDFKFDWCKEVEMGIPLMDTQHKELFRIGRDLEQLVICYCIGVTNDQLLRIILELRDYVCYHCYHEEELMKESNYPDYENHKKKHDGVIQFISNVDCKKLGEEPYEILCKVKLYLQDWIFSHILIDDVAFSKYFHEHNHSK